MSLTTVLVFFQGAPDFAVLVEQIPSVLLLVAEVSEDDFFVIFG